MVAKTARRQQNGEESRRRILDATIEIASERGYEGTTISLISKRSGLPASSIYWHFSSKDELLAAVIDRSFDEWRRRREYWEPPAAPPGGRRAWLHELMAGVARSIEEMPEFLRLGLLLTMENRPVEAAARERYVRIRRSQYDLLVIALERALAELPDDERRPAAQRLAAFILALADGLFLAANLDPEGTDLHRQFAELADMLDGACERLLAPR